MKPTGFDMRLPAANPAGWEEIDRLRKQVAAARAMLAALLNGERVFQMDISAPGYQSALVASIEARQSAIAQAEAAGIKAEG